MHVTGRISASKRKRLHSNYVITDVSHVVERIAPQDQRPYAHHTMYKHRNQDPQAKTLEQIEDSVKTNMMPGTPRNSRKDTNGTYKIRILYFKSHIITPGCSERQILDRWEETEDTTRPREAT